MNPFFKTTAAAAALCLGLQAHAMISAETKQVADQIGASTLTEVKFDEKSAMLTDAQKKELTTLVADARAKGEINKIKVLVWADKEYPTANAKPAKSDIQLADNRIKEIKKYLKDQLNIGDVDTYNMAERPNKVQEWLNTPEAKVKKTAENTGAAPRTKDETGWFGLKGQTSKAVAFVFMK